MWELSGLKQRLPLEILARETNFHPTKVPRIYLSINRSKSDRILFDDAWCNNRVKRLSSTTETFHVCSSSLTFEVIFVANIQPSHHNLASSSSNSITLDKPTFQMLTFVTVQNHQLRVMLCSMTWNAITALLSRHLASFSHNFSQAEFPRCLMKFNRHQAKKRKMSKQLKESEF